MAYKQNKFPTHVNTLPKSPVEQWDWYEENVKDQGYLSAAGTGAQIGAKVGGGPWGAAFGAVIAVGAKAIQNNPGEGGDGMENMADNTGGQDLGYGRQQSYFKAQEEEAKVKKAADDKTRWGETTETNKINKLKTQYSQSLDPNKMANALRKSQKQKENPVENTDITSTATTSFVPEVNKPYIPPSKEDISLSPASQIVGGMANSPKNEFDPIRNPFSTNQSILNSNDPTNIAVKYAQINNISKDLVSDSPINQKSEYYKQLDPLWREKALSKEKDKKELWEKEHGTAYREDVQSKLKRRGGKKRWEMSADDIKKEKEDIKKQKEITKSNTVKSKNNKPKSSKDVFNEDINKVIEHGGGGQQQEYLTSIDGTKEVKSKRRNVAFTPWKAQRSNRKNYLDDFKASIQPQTYK